MSYAYWTVLIAGLMPYVATIISKWRCSYDNAQPRVGLDQLPPMNRRANWAQLNAFEAFPLFASAIIIAHIVKVDQLMINQLAVLFITFRALYIWAYIADWPKLRSAFWLGALICVVYIFIMIARVG